MFLFVKGVKKCFDLLGINLNLTVNVLSLGRHLKPSFGENLHFLMVCLREAGRIRWLIDSDLESDFMLINRGLIDLMFLFL